MSYARGISTETVRLCCYLLGISYTADALDLCDALSSFSARDRASLNEIARVMGLPGKPDGMHGGEVDRFFQEGRFDEIARYCVSDVVNTYQLWLRYELFRGRLSMTEYEASESAIASLTGQRSGCQ
jgi:predicted PolB exonuclease-like 3'-5' exonuclease